MNCIYCGKKVTRELTKYQKYTYKKTGRVYCSNECMKKYLSELSSKRMKKLNETNPGMLKRHQEMKTKNPMFIPEIKEKMKESIMKKVVQKKSNGQCWFQNRGGNGKGYTIPQIKLYEALKKLNPILEYVVPTKLKRTEGYPSCYKIDIAIIQYLIAIEVDGKSHELISRKEQDQKKDIFLKEQGWKVLRFKNQQVMEHLEDCVKMVMSII